MHIAVGIALVALVAVAWRFRAAVLSVRKADAKYLIFELEKLAVKSDPELQVELFSVIQKLKNIV